MCKYCKLYYNEKTGEKTNKKGNIMTFRDGYQSFIISINRYVVENEDVDNSAELILEYCVSVNHRLFSIVTREIKIKYCPFCGEKL